VIADGLGHRFGRSPWLFRGLAFQLDPGRVYALTGPSGSGKSTLLALLAGWTAPSEGTLERRDVERVGWVFQNPHGSPRRAAIDHVRLPFLARGIPPGEAVQRAAELIRRFGLESVAASDFRQLSGGEAQRLMLARGVAASPDLLLVDEPTAQLDPATAENVNDAISSLAAGHSIVVVATHDPRTRDACSDHIDLGRGLGR